MKVLLIKTSSLGDLIHAFPALTDAMQKISNLQVDWVVEETFALVPKLHPVISEVIPIATKRWRRHFWKIQSYKEVWRLFIKLHSTSYDVVIDAQGLLKAAIVSSFVKTRCSGYSFDCVREKAAALFYSQRFSVSQKLHAVESIRQLFALSLGYTLPTTEPDFSLENKQRSTIKNEGYILFFHGTMWKNKHWPSSYWIMLANLLNEKGLPVKLSWGSEKEKKVSELIASKCDSVTVLKERCDLHALLPLIENATAVVGTDTGLCHLAAAMNIPTLALFGPTDAKLTGLSGLKQKNLSVNFPCAPCLVRRCHYKGKSEVSPACFATLPPRKVFEELMELV